MKTLADCVREEREGALRRHGKLVIHGRLVRWNDVEVPLTEFQFKIIEMLVDANGLSVSYRAIYDNLYFKGYQSGKTKGVASECEMGYRTNVRSSIKRIRQHFKKIDPGFKAMVNISGEGYRWITG